MTNVSTPIAIGKKIAKNRITMAPTVKFVAGDDGLVTEELIKHYEERAKYDCGFICVEATCIDKEARLHPKQIGLWNDEQIAGHKRIVDACHAYGALIVPQLHHGGLGTHPECGPMTGPSAIQWMNGFGQEAAEVKALSEAEIQKVVENFVQGALRAKKAGYDGVQLHGCHAYLINDFASAANQRSDQYGGSTENRARLGCEVIEGIRKACGEDFIISMRISGCDPTVEESIAVGEYYVAAGCDYLQVSNGIASLDEVEHDENLPYNKVASLGVRFHEHFKGKVPVSLVNGIRKPETVHYLMDHDLIDTVDLACGLLADPAFAKAILEGTPYEMCRSCNGCGFGPNHHVCPAMKARGANEFSVM